MRKTGLTILILMLFCVFAAGKVVTLSGLIKPFYLNIDDKFLYVTDGPQIHIYSLKDISFVKKFGKAGEGPGEFKIDPHRSAGSVMIDVDKEKILINSLGRISFFTKDGKFIKEKQVQGRLSLRLLGDKFVGERFKFEDKKNYFIEGIYNAEFEQEKELYRREAFSQQEGKLNPFYILAPKVLVFENKVFINGANEIYVFDDAGKKLYTIRYEFEKLPVTSSYKKDIDTWFKTYPPLKPFYESIKDRFGFPEYIPGIRDFKVADGKVYVLTYKKKDNKYEFVIMDIKGKFLKKEIFPFVDRNKFGWCPYVIKDGILYQLVENEDEEEWELHIHNSEN